MKVEEAFSAFCSELAGIPISHIWQGHGSAVFLEIGTLTPTVRRDGTSGNPTGEIGVMVECSWRIEANHSIICGSWSNEHLWQPTFERLKGETITKFELFGAIPELLIETRDGVRFMSFSTAEEQPDWTVFDRRGAVDTWFHVKNGNLSFDHGAKRS